MFTGIIEDIAVVENIQWDRTNVVLTLSSQLANAFYIDQSIAHNGVCLTVVEVQPPLYKVVLIEETINRTNFKYIQKGDLINIERSMRVNDRLDGHFVTGHVDTTGVCETIIDKNGSKEIIIRHPENPFFITIPKGSIAVNGISLTVVQSAKDYFSVHIIPYTWEHTNLKTLKIKDIVNLEFDIFGKYIANYLSNLSQLQKH